MIIHNKKGITGWIIWAAIFLIIGVVASIFGFGSVAGTSYTVAKWLAILFIALFIITLIARTIKRA